MYKNVDQLLFPVDPRGKVNFSSLVWADVHHPKMAVAASPVTKEDDVEKEANNKGESDDGDKKGPERKKDEKDKKKQD
jgi:hypothetical protein